MEGYSVTEAASILGVPTERVWELLARGVLAGAPEGETGMRVYLQPRPAPASPAPEPSRPNGDAQGGEPSRELSPFRELLTEFRNLTERYGQALLALGEARGEVAALRSRVDLLEARMDLRLPMSAGPMTPPTAWPTPLPAPPTPAAGEPVGHGAADDHPEEEERPRRRGARRATESFAEALARAEDPTRPELPDAAETAAALAALRDEADAAATEAVLPRELPAAEPMPLPDEPEPMPPAETAAEPVIEPSSDSGPEWEPSPGPAPVLEAPAEPEPEPAAVAEQAPQPEPEPPVAAELAAEPEAEAVAVDAATTATLPESPAAAADGREPETERAPAEPIAWDPERYTVEIVEPDWYAEEEPAAPAVHATAPAAAPGPAAEQETGSAPTPSAEPRTPPASQHDPTELRPAGQGDEETMLWFGRTPPAASDASSRDVGADEMEVVGAQPRTGPAPLPGSEELDHALAALDALAPPPAPHAEPSQEVDEDEDEGWPPAAGRESTDVPARAQEPELPAAGMGTLTSLTRPTPTPATRAYRRLRRIFPG